MYWKKYAVHLKTSFTPDFEVNLEAHLSQSKKKKTLSLPRQRMKEPIASLAHLLGVERYTELHTHALRIIV
jgi:hypothetical protein